MNESVVPASDFTLADNEAAVVISPDSIRLVTPDKDHDEEVGHNVSFAVMLAYLASTDTEWVASVVKRFEEQTDD